MRTGFLIGLFFAIYMQVGYGQMTSASMLLEERGAIVLRPSNIYSNPYCLEEIWMDEPLPLEFYSEEEKESQRIINEETTDKIVTYSPVEGNSECVAIDDEEITPYTWKWIDLGLQNSDGTFTKINLRRPHWWIKQMHADRIGDSIYLNTIELGVQGWATVIAIRANQLDTRLWDEHRISDYVVRPITGKFQHESNNVYSLQFDKSGELIGVTGEHPFWSIDRNGWVGAANLQIGEYVKTQEGSAQLIIRSKKSGWHNVYNIEVFKDHNYLTSINRILVHNNKIPSPLLRRPIAGFMDGFQINGRKIFPGDPHTDAKGVNEMVELMRSGKFDWNLTPPKDRIVINVFPNGRLQIGDGHHRIYAARLLGRDIPWANRKAIIFERIHSNPARNLDWKDVNWTENVREKILNAAE